MRTDREELALNLERLAKNLRLGAVSQQSLETTLHLLSGLIAKAKAAGSDSRPG